VTHKLSLDALAREQLQVALGASSGRSARTVYGGHEHGLRQTLIALAAGRLLAEHLNTGEATVQVLRGAGAHAQQRRLLGRDGPATCCSFRTRRTTWRPSRTQSSY
jgi:hypothetical protein